MDNPAPSYVIELVNEAAKEIRGKGHALTVRPFACEDLRQQAPEFQKKRYQSQTLF